MVSRQSDSLFEFTIQETHFLYEQDSQDEFGHQAIVDALENAVCVATPPFCIGVIGEWGVGKSFVLKRLEKQLRQIESSKRLRVFYFDAWKYAGESTKRSFLIRLLHEEGLLESKKGQDWIAQLYHTQQKPLRLKAGTTLGLLLFGGLLPAVFACILILGSWIGFLPEWEKALSGVTLATVLMSLAMLFLTASRFVRDAFQTAWETVSIPPLASAEQFEAILEKFLTERKIKRAVVLIDELDRCDEKSRAEVLQGLRTYLRNDKCVYVVAGAPKTLSVNPTPSPTEPERSADFERPDEEFLRKLFHITFWMDSQGEENLRKYTERLLRDAGFATEDRHLVEIVVLGNTRSPRRIKHFLNTLRFTLRVAAAREAAGEIEHGRVTDNVAFLAKVLLLRQDWPQEFSEIIRRPRLLREWTEQTRTEFPQSSRPNLHRFLRSTDQIIVDDPLSFFAVTTGVAEGVLLRDAALIEAAFSSDHTRAKEIVARKDSEEYRKWSEVLFREFRQCQRENDYQLLRNGLEVACSLIDYVPVDQQQAYADRICTLLQAGQIQNALPPDAALLVFHLATKASPNRVLPALRCYLQKALTLEGIDSHIGEALERHAHELPPEVRDTLSREILEEARKKSGEQRTLLFKVYQQWPKDEKLVEKLVSSEVLDRLIEQYGQESIGKSVSARDAIRVTGLLDVLFRLKSAWNQTIQEKVIDLMLSPLEDQPQNGVLDNTQSYSLHWLKELIKLDGNALPFTKILAVLQGILQHLLPSPKGKFYDRNAVEIMRIALNLNATHEQSTKDTLTDMLEHFCRRFARLLPILCRKVHQESPASPTEKVLTTFLTQQLTNNKQSEYFMATLVGMEQREIVEKALRELAKSPGFDGFVEPLSAAWRSTLELAEDEDEQSLSWLFLWAKELEQHNQLAVFTPLLSIIAEHCPRWGIFDYTRTSGCLFESSFPFMTKEVRAQVASNYSMAIGLNEFVSSPYMIEWLDRLWPDFSQEDLQLIFTGLSHFLVVSAETLPDKVEEGRKEQEKSIVKVLRNLPCFLNVQGTELANSLSKLHDQRTDASYLYAAFCVAEKTLVDSVWKNKLAGVPPSLYRESDERPASS